MDAKHLKVSQTIRVSDARYNLVFVTYKRGGHYLGQGYLYQNSSTNTMGVTLGRHRWYRYNDMRSNGYAPFNCTDEFDHEWEAGNVFAATYVRIDEAAGKGFFSIEHAHTDRGKQAIRPGNLLPPEYVDEVY
jgi:hypothetical protein